MPKMSVNQRNKFVKDFLKEEAKGNPILILLMPILVAIFQKLLDRFLQKEAE